MRNYRDDSIDGFLSEYRKRATKKAELTETIRLTLMGMCILILISAFLWAFAMIGEMDLHGANKQQHIEGERI